MKPRDSVVSASVVLLIALVLVTSMCVETAVGSPTNCEPVSCIPADATIESATLGLYVGLASDQEIRLHRITDPWDEAAPRKL